MEFKFTGANLADRFPHPWLWCDERSRVPRRRGSESTRRRKQSHKQLEQIGLWLDYSLLVQLSGPIQALVQILLPLI